MQGSAPGLQPYMLLAHMDVVPAPPEGWDFPPFSAAEHEGFIYGRGTLDNKNSAIVRVLGKVLPQRDSLGEAEGSNPSPWNSLGSLSRPSFCEKFLNPAVLSQLVLEVEWSDCCY